MSQDYKKLDMRKTSLSTHRSATLPALTAAVVLLTATAQNLQAAITVTFTEMGGDVVATLSGSLDLTGLVRVIDDLQRPSGTSNFNSDQYFAVGPGNIFDAYDGGDVFPHTISIMPDTIGVSETFGFDNQALAVPGSTSLNDPSYTPSAGQTITWSGQTLADIGLGSLSATPLTVWNNPNATGTAGAFQFVGVPVPEPSSSLLLCLAGLGLFSHRKR